jgi:hypothetical protein
MIPAIDSTIRFGGAKLQVQLLVRWTCWFATVGNRVDAEMFANL